MKQSITLAISLTLLMVSAYAQPSCGQGRYLIDAFDSVVVTQGIVFGSNAQPTITDPNAVQTLRLDLYEPYGDTASERPLLIMAFGGAFLLGSRQDADVTEICQRMARKGYVCAAIDYRLTPELFFTRTESLAFQAVMKAVHDMRAAVRFFRADADTAMTYRINTSQIYAGGISAGGVTALHLAYLNDPGEWPEIIAVDSAALGGFEGLSGSPGYSSEVAGVVNLCGAIGDTTWMQADEVPVFSAHGTSDDVVPYGSSASLGLFDIDMQVQGSGVIHTRAVNLGLEEQLLTWPGVGHVPFSMGANADAFMDEVIGAMSNELFLWVCVNSQSTSIAPELAAQAAQRLYPQPAREAFIWEFAQPISAGASLRGYNAQGQEVALAATRFAEGWQIQRGTLPAGMYWLQAIDANGGLLARSKCLLR